MGALDSQVWVPGPALWLNLVLRRPQAVPQGLEARLGHLLPVGGMTQSWGQW